MNAALALLGAWLLGTIPFAWILVRWRTGQDLAAAGSGNVGALNSLRVSRSRAVGASVLLLDLLKGVAAVLLARLLAPTPPVEHAAAVLAILGHSLNPWLSLKRRRLSGGKGFATAAGGLLVLAPVLVAIWCAVLVLCYALFRAAFGQRDEAPASLVATLAVPLSAALLEPPPALWSAAGLALVISWRLVPEVVGLLRARGAAPSDRAA